MSSRISIIVHVTTDVEQLRNRIVQHVIIFPPPYREAVNQILQPYRAAQGRQIDVVITHGTKDVSIVDQNIRHHVIRTAILSFQNHRIRDLPTSPFPLRQFNHVASARRLNRQRDRPTNQSCSICFETIMESDMQMLPCAHGFHDHCIGRWTLENSSCPVCRHPLA
jgi:hypothetical protein